MTPQECCESIEGIDLEAFAKKGKRLILLDIDNTLTHWQGEDVPQGVLNWLERGKALGLQFCAVSNTRRRARLARLSEKLGIEAVQGRFKPSRDMFHQAMEKFKVGPEACLMIGDQLLTDIYGARRAGMDALLVHPLSGREFIGTRVNRLLERVLGWGIELGLEPLPDRAPGFLQRRIVRQFIKFCIVGGSSFVIDYCVRMTLMFAVSWDGELMSVRLGNELLERFPELVTQVKTPSDAAIPLAAGIAACIAMLNSFFWNRRWTFRINDPAERLKHFRRFFVVSGIGLLLNVVLTTLFNHLIPGEPKMSLRIATILATICVAFWNFGGQRLYAFKKSGSVNSIE